MTKICVALIPACSRLFFVVDPDHAEFLAFLAHESRETGSSMNFAVYLPPQAQAGLVPALYFLAGLTCSEETFMVKQTPCVNDLVRTVKITSLGRSASKTDATCP